MSGPRVDTLIANAESAPSRDVTRRRHHRDMLLIALFVIAAAALLQVDAERVHVAGLPALALPPLCGSRILFNRDCPACGTTRSFVHLAHGDWTAAFAANRAGWLLAIAVLVQLPYRWIALRRKVDYPLGRRIPLLFGWFVIIALIGNWLAKVLGY